jgi:hypothetical protein
MIAYPQEGRIMRLIGLIMIAGLLYGCGGGTSFEIIGAPTATAIRSGTPVPATATPIAPTFTASPIPSVTNTATLAPSTTATSAMAATSTVAATTPVRTATPTSTRTRTATAPPTLTPDE